MNSTNLVGRITRDPELRKIGTGKSVLNFSVAVNREFNKDQTDFIDCVAWEQTAEFIANYLTKGALVSVRGRIESGSYEDATGKKVYTQTVVAERVQALESKAQREGTAKPVYEKKEEKILDIDSSSLPF